VNAIRSRPIFILLGLRGQANSRSYAMLVTLLDEIDPDPRPAARSTTIRSSRSRSTAASYRRAGRSDARSGCRGKCGSSISWRTPTSRSLPHGAVGPIKARAAVILLSDELTMPKTCVLLLLPRANRGIFAIN